MNSVNPVKTIGMDVRMWSHPGIGRYIRELVSALASQSFHHRLVLIGNPPVQEIKSLPASFSLKEAASPIYGLSEQLEMLLKAKGLDLLHVPHFNIPVFTTTKLVTTVHDLTYLREKSALKSDLGRVYARFLFNVLQNKSEAIITVSEFTKKDLLEFYPKLDEKKVFVIYEAASPIFSSRKDPTALEKVSKHYQLIKPFVLFVGSLKVHKNIPILIEAMKIAKDKYALEQELVIVGKSDPKNQDVLRLIAENSFVRYLGECSDVELSALYASADLFALPSLREGFGLPVVEAMASGAPVICSNRSSLPELLGDAGVLFEPDRVDALAEVLYNVLKDNELRKKMSQAGLKRASHFSWQRTARETLAVYEKALA